MIVRRTTLGRDISRPGRDAVSDTGDGQRVGSQWNDIYVLDEAAGPYLANAPKRVASNAVRMESYSSASVTCELQPVAAHSDNIGDDIEAVNLCSKA